jgi:hypothetical protein
LIKILDIFKDDLKNKNDKNSGAIFIKVEELD